MSYLKKVKVGTTTYDLGDAGARQALMTLLGLTTDAQLDAWTGYALGTAAQKDYTTTVTDAAPESGKLPTGAAVKSYVDAQIGTINKFDVVVDPTGTASGPSVTASADTMYKLYLVPDAEASAGAYIEWITIRTGTAPNYTYAWEKIGSTVADLSGYVPTSTKIAGATLEASRNASELVSGYTGAAIEKFGTLALKSQATGTVPSRTNVSFTSTYTPAGSVSVTLADASTWTNASVTGASYTPSGNVTFATGLTNYVTAAALSKTTTGGIQIEGSVGATGFTEIRAVGVSGAIFSYDDATGTTPSQAVINTTWTANPFTAATCTFPTLGSTGTSTTASFATSGVLATVGTGTESETLILSSATLASAYTSVKTYTLTGGSFTGGSFDSSKLSVTTAALSSGSYVVGLFDIGAGDDASHFYAPVTGSPTFTFTGAKYNVSLTSTTKTMPTATFAGTASTITPAVAYHPQYVSSATFSGTQATITTTGTVPSATVTVS